jgi:hypothetical protein
MTDIESFKADLIDRTTKPTNLRPFVCEGSPLECQAFIVGFNPATEMSGNFWDFWRAGYGFDKARWLAEYVEERKRRPLRPGKTRRPTMSPTRRVIEWVVDGASPVHVLETNLHAVATAMARELGEDQQDTNSLEFLIEKINPQVIVAHGKEAMAYIHGRYPDIRVIPVDHFSRGWSQVSARALGQQIRDACGM